MERNGSKPCGKHNYSSFQNIFFNLTAFILTIYQGAGKQWKKRIGIRRRKEQRQEENKKQRRKKQRKEENRNQKKKQATERREQESEEEISNGRREQESEEERSNGRREQESEEERRNGRREQESEEETSNGRREQESEEERRKKEEITDGFVKDYNTRNEGSKKGPKSPKYNRIQVKKG